MAANKGYTFHAIISYQSATAAGFQWDFTGPGGETNIAWILSVVNPGAAIPTASANSGSYPGENLAVVTATTPGQIHLELHVQNGATAGNLSFRWAQGTSNAGNTTVLSGSKITVTEA